MPVRPAEPRDIPAIIDMIAHCGFPARSAQGWAWALFGNPDQGALPAGYVARDASDTASAFLASLALRLKRGSEQRIAVLGHTFITGANGRGQGLAVLNALLSEDRKDCELSMSNNPISSDLFHRLNLPHAKDEAAQLTLDWPIRSLRHAAGRALNFAARRETAYRLLSRREWFTGASAQLVSPQGLDPERPEDEGRLGGAIEAIEASHEPSGRWHVARSIAGFRWRLGDPDAPGRSLLLADPSGALLLVTLTKPNPHEPMIAQVSDLDCVSGEAGQDMLCGLLAEACRAAREAGAALLRLSMPLGFDVSRAGSIGPYRLRRSAYHRCFLRSRGDLDIVLRLYMSDLVLALRTPQGRFQADAVRGLPR